MHRDSMAVQLNDHLMNLKPVRIISRYFVLRFMITCIFGLSFTTEVLADKDDTFNILLGTDYQHNDNLFLLPDGQKPLGSGAKRSDNIFKTKVGFKINKKYALQVFKFDYTHEDIKYDNSKYLNFKSNNYKAAWQWSITPSLKGNLSADRSVDLVPFSDFRNNSSIQNIRTKEIQFFDFDFSPHNVWHLLGGYTKLNVTNSQTFLPETSFKMGIVEAGVKYSFPSNSFIALKARKSEGENQAINLAQLVGKGFTENQEELSASWLVTGKSTISSNLGYIQKIDDSFSIRDYSGYFGGINYAWDITGKFNLNVDLSRRLASYQDSTSSYTENDTFTIRPTWFASSKISVNAFTQIGKRKFLGDGPIFNPDKREDDSLIYGVGANWTPFSTVKISANLQHDERDSNFNNRDYTSNSATLSGQVLF